MTEVANPFPALLRRAVLHVSIAFVIVPIGTSFAQTKAVHLASTAWPPFTGVPGKPRFALDLVHTALGRIGIVANTDIVDERQLTPVLINGEFDGSAALWRSDERGSVLIYSDAYLENRLILVGRKGSDISAKSMSSLAGKKLALVEGYAYGDSVHGANGPIFVPSSSEEDSLHKLLSGEADYTLMDELVVEYITKNYSKEARTRLAIGSTPLVVRSLHLALNRNLPDAQSIIDQFNAELKRMIADRSYHRLLQVDWIEADIDGDGKLEFVPSDDKVGKVAPDHGYKLFTTTTATEPSSKPRYYFGGKVFNDWASVPDIHKAPRPPGTLTGGAQYTFFTFKW